MDRKGFAILLPLYCPYHSHMCKFYPDFQKLLSRISYRQFEKSAITNMLNYITQLY